MRAITKWTKSCFKRLARLISYIHQTSEYQQYRYVGNTAPQCRLGLFQDSDFVGDLEDSKSTSGGILCIFGSHTFVPISWMCKKQTSVSHSSTEAEIISLDAGLRMDGIPALTLWDLVIEVCHSAILAQAILAQGNSIPDFCGVCCLWFRLPAILAACHRHSISQYHITRNKSISQFQEYLLRYHARVGNDAKRVQSALCTRMHCHVYCTRL